MKVVNECRGLHGGAEMTCQVRKHRTLRSWVQERKYDYLLWIMFCFVLFCFLLINPLYCKDSIIRILNKTMWIWVYIYVWVCRWIYLCVCLYSHISKRKKRYSFDFFLFDFFLSFNYFHPLSLLFLFHLSKNLLQEICSFMQLWT